MSVENITASATKIKPKSSKFAELQIIVMVALLATFISAVAVLLSPHLSTWQNKLEQGMIFFCVGFLTLCCVHFYMRRRAEKKLHNQNAAFEAESDELDEIFLYEYKDDLFSLALTDELTQLGNRHRMVEKFKTLQTVADVENSKFLMGLVNIDGMKSITDLYGAEAADEVLLQCAQRLSATVENEGFVFRYGGDRFGFLFPKIVDQELAKQYGHVLLDVLQAPFTLDGSVIRISGTFGFAIYPDAGGDFESVMKSVSSALYFANRNKQSPIAVYSDEIEQLVRENTHMEHLLRIAVVKNQIEPYFQPIISIQDGSLLGFEALARWTDDELGSVSPAKFIPLAEERGIIFALTEKLLYNAARVAAQWPDELFLSFNLSSIQLCDPSTAEDILKTIRRAGLPASRLEIEVTETAMMNSAKVAEEVIEQLHNAGVKISMDDFGTGHSSLGRLRELKLDKLKIDRAFVTELGKEKSADHIVRAILEMCAGLELAVVAEGIEEMPQAEILKSYGCYAGQGYLFGKPQDEHATGNYIRAIMHNLDESEEEYRYSA